jgi:ribosomal protein S18 acetylase RimI-like enzyme
MTVEIRPATLTDYEPICKLMAQIDALHRNTHPDRFREAQPVREKAFLQSWLDDTDKHIWVAEGNSGIAGVMMFTVRQAPDVPFLVSRTFIQLETLVVDERQQRREIGRALMEAVHQWGREHLISDIELVVWAFNEAAIAFYRHLGYEILYCRMHQKLD